MCKYCDVIAKCVMPLQYLFYVIETGTLLNWSYKYFIILNDKFLKGTSSLVTAYIVSFIICCDTIDNIHRTYDTDQLRIKLQLHKMLCASV